MGINNTQVFQKSNTQVVCENNTNVLALINMRLNYGERLKAARKQKKLSQAELAKISGVGQGSISKIERGDQDTSAYDVELSYALDVNPLWLKNGDQRFLPPWLGGNFIEGQIIRPSLPTPSNVEPGPDITGRVPLISWVQAGEWAEVIDHHLPGQAEEWRLTTAKCSHHAYALRIVGDSMTNPYGSPSIPEGYIVIVEPERAAKNGDIVIARLDDSMEATIKKLVIEGNTRYLKPLNPSYPVIHINGNCTLCGVVIKVEFDL